MILIKNTFKLLLCWVLISVAAPAYAEQKSTDTTASAKSNDVIGNMLLQSMDLIGIPYKWGGNTPDSGLDCSGFIRYIFKKSLGITLPRTAAEMSRLGKKVPLDQLEPGDLLFFNTLGGSRVSHIGMYLGNNQFIQSPRTGKSIEVTELSGYYREKLLGAKRMVEEDTDDDGNPVLNDFQDVHESIGSGKKSKRSHKKRRH